MEKARNRDPLARPCTSTQTAKPPVESRGIPHPSESFASSANTSSRFYIPASSRRISAGPGGGVPPCCGIASFERGRNDNKSSSLRRDGKERIAGESPLRMRPNAATVSRRDPPPCSCFLRRRCDKATETSAPVVYETSNKDFARTRVSREHSPAAPVPKKTSGGCHARRENTTDEPGSGSMIRFYKTYDKAASQDSAALAASGIDCMAKKLPSKVVANDLTPKEIMNAWVPGKERPVEGLFEPSENYVDVSTRDFSLRKYFPEMFLSETEKNAMRANEQRESQERDAATRKDRCENKKYLQGEFNGEKDKSDPDWRTIIELGSKIRTPCPWSEEGTSLTQARKEASDEESNVELTPEKRPRAGWFRWACGKSRRAGKKAGEKKRDGRQD